MKYYYFISGLPRSGSTLLSSILRQNPKFYADIGSPVESVIGASIDVITSSENNNIVQEQQRKNLLYGIFEGYYAHIEKPVIFDTSRNWTKKTSLIKKIFPYSKILCPVRDIVSILNSFELIFSKNPLYTNTLLIQNPFEIENKQLDSVFSRCHKLIGESSGIIARSLISLLEGYSINPDMIHFIEYDELCKNPENTIKKVYQFLNFPYYSHNFNNVKYSNKSFDMNCNLKNFHTVYEKVEYKEKKIILPLEIIEKYKNEKLEFWRKKLNEI